MNIDQLKESANKEKPVPSLFNLSSIKYWIAVFIFLLSQTVHALTLAKTTANSLNLRSSPGGEVVFSLPKGSHVGLVEVKGTWAMVIYMPNGSADDAKFGWVSTAYLELLNGRGKIGPGYSVSGDSCSFEYDSGAQVCVTATDIDIDCRESFDRTYYRGCDVEVDYEVSTDYEGEDHLSADVECEVDIKYKERDGYLWKYDSDDESENHSLYSYGSESGDMDLEFTFSSFREVIQVKVDGVECEISSVYHY
ncbi:SH3 domain-containing protein [Amphritea sp. HPY]|uniref:SH3 domain-containing protein n=1 Tax=Amphritea sp. HPY TaxID=3421652 RepID=UPI003D7D9BCA